MPDMRLGHELNDPLATMELGLLQFLSLNGVDCRPTHEGSHAPLIVIFTILLSRPQLTKIAPALSTAIPIVVLAGTS